MEIEVYGEDFHKHEKFLCNLKPMYLSRNKTSMVTFKAEVECPEFMNLNNLTGVVQVAENSREEHDSVRFPLHSIFYLYTLTIPRNWLVALATYMNPSGWRISLCNNSEHS